jgi:competence protein ComEC
MPITSHTARFPFVPHPVASLAIAFIIGLGLAEVAHLNVAVVTSACLLAGVIAIFLLSSGRLLLATSMVLIGFMAAGVADLELEKSSQSQNRLKTFYDSQHLTADDPVVLEGVLDREPEQTPDGEYVQLSVDSIRIGTITNAVRGKVGLWSSFRSPDDLARMYVLELRYGARIRVATRLDRGDRFRNAGVTPYKDVLDREGIDATGSIKSPILVERLDDERVFLPLAYIYEWRRLLISRIHLLFSEGTAGTLSAVMFGNGRGLSSDAAARFREGGTFHLLVISGFHVTFLALILNAFGGLLTSRRASRFVIVSILLWAYVLAVGAGPPVVRAAFVFTLISFGGLFERSATPLNSMGAAALAILVWSPEKVFDPSLHLTFVSILAIELIAAPVIRNAEAIGKWRPSASAPFPPACGASIRKLSEILFWSEKDWKKELRGSSFTYKLVKSPLAARLERMHLQKPLRYIVSAIIVSLAVGIALLPLQVVYFHRVSIASLVLNVVIGLVMALMCASALLAVVLSGTTEHIRAVLVHVTEAFNWLMLHLIDPFRSIHLASYRIPSYSGVGKLVYIAFAIMLGCTVVLLVRWQPLSRPSAFVPSVRRRALTAAPAMMAAICAVTIVIHPFAGDRAPGRLRIDFIDVGQGDSALLTMPDGTTFLVDGGGRPGGRNRNIPNANTENEEDFESDRRSIGEAVVSQFLWERGFDSIDYVLATHGDADHIDGLNDVIRNFSVKGAFVARYPSRNREFIHFAANAKSLGIPVQLIGAGDELRFAGVSLQVLSPDRTDDVDAPYANNDSIALRVSYNLRSVLLTGDIERPAEERLLSRNTDLTCDVIKVAHHGSDTSSIDDFVRATKAKYAVVSVGLRSPFGHPKQDVVDRWQQAGADVLITGKCGTITFETDGSELKLWTYVPCE